MLAQAVEAASAAGGSDVGTAAIIGAVGSVVLGVLAALFKFAGDTGTRVDRSQAEVVSVLRTQLADALDGENRMRDERDAAFQREAAAYRERDRWQTMWTEEQHRANGLEVDLAAAKGLVRELRRTKGRTDEL